MAEDYVRSMNLGGGSHFSSVIGNVKNTVNDINTLMNVSIQRASLLVSKLTQAAKELRNATAAANGGGTVGGTTSSSIVMNQPMPGKGGGSGSGGTWHQDELPPPPPTAPSSGGGMGGFKNAIAAASGSMTPGQKMAVAMTAMPGANAQVEQNYLTDRSIFYGQAENINHPGKFWMDPRERQYNSISARQRAFGQRGTITDPLDASRAMTMATQMGVQIQNTSVRNGIADMSNLTPGVGLSASTAAYAQLQTGSTVNKLRFMGIQTRDRAGHQLGFTQIADQLWQKLNRQKTKKGPLTKDDLTISLESGNALSNIVDQISGGDSVLRDQLVAALYQKASGASGKDEFSKVNMAKSGGTTAAINSLSSRTDKAAQTLQDTARSGATGVMVANDTAVAMSNFTNALNKFTGVVGFMSGVGNAASGIAGIANGAVGMLLKAVLNPASLLGGLFKADGGPVDNKTPYVVGERGPELFVPQSDGIIVPNHMLDKRGRGDGGPVYAKGMTDKSTPDQFATALLGGLGMPITPASIKAIKTWSRFEGGNWKNSAHYNPLNTTLHEKGSTSMNYAGVQSFSNWSTGVQATIETLKNTKGVGYEAILASLKTGKSSSADILKAISASHWAGRPGKYEKMGMLGSTTSDYKTNGMYKGKGGIFTQMGAAVNNAVHGAENFVGGVASALTGGGSTGMGGYFNSANTGGGGGGSSATYNYGGVTVVVQGSKDPKATAAEVHKTLASADLLNKARTK